LRCDAQLLFYPALDPTMSSPSHRALATGYLLNHPTIEFYWRRYLDGQARDADGRVRDVHSRMNPGLAHDDDLAGLPPTVITTSGFDPLQDEGSAYAGRLRSAGVCVCRLHQPRLIHGWVDQCDVLPAAASALDEVLETFRRVALG
jgi:acetyl esterase